MNTLEVRHYNRDIDTERVIDEVRIRKCLWDASDQLYKSKEARLNAWNEIAITLFGDLPRHDKAILDKLIQQRWKTARDAYHRSKSRLKNTPSGSGVKKVTKYIFYDKLGFLDNVEENVVKESIAETTNSTDISSEDENENTRNKAETISLQTTQVVDSDTHEIEDKSEVIDIVTQRPWKNRRKNVRPRSARQNQLQIEKKLLAASRKKDSDISSDDLAFFSSLGPVLKSFDIYQKMEFRSRVLSIAKDTLFKTYTNPRPSSEQ